MGFGGYMIGGIVLEGILMAFTIAFLLPILLGGLSVTPISEVIPLWWPIVKAGAIAMLAVTVLSLIPIIGGLIAHSPAIETFVEGVIIFRFFSEYSVNQMLIEANARGSVYPGFWACIGFIIITTVIVYLIIFGLALLSMPFEGTVIGEFFLIIGGRVFCVLGGMIPLFMYSSYTRLALMQLIGR